MFTFSDHDLADHLDMLRLHKAVYDSTGHTSGDCLCPDALFEEFFCALEDLCSDIQFFEPERYEGNTVFLFHFDTMPSFYDLCHKHSRRLGIAFQNDPYYQEARNSVTAFMDAVPDYSFAWKLNVPKKIVKQKSYFLLVETTPDFFHYVDLIEALFGIRTFYIEAEHRLQKEGDAVILPFPTRDHSTVRRAA